MGELWGVYCILEKTDRVITVPRCIQRYLNHKLEISLFGFWQHLHQTLKTQHDKFHLWELLCNACSTMPPFIICCYDNGVTDWYRIATAPLRTPDLRGMIAKCFSHLCRLIITAYSLATFTVLLPSRICPPLVNVCSRNKDPACWRCIEKHYDDTLRYEIAFNESCYYNDLFTPSILLDEIRFFKWIQCSDL